MPSPPRASFRARLVAVDHETATAFVAAVYAAREWTVDRRGDGLRATPPGADRPRRLVVDIGEEHADTEADTKAADGVETIRVDAERLHELVAYALPAAERARLCREFLDREFDALDAPPTADRVGTEAGREARDGTSHETGGTRQERGGEAPTSEPTGDRQPRDDPPERDGASSASEEARGSMTRRERLVRVGVAAVALSVVLGGIVTAAGPGLTGPAAAIIDGNGTTDDPHGQAGEEPPAANDPWPRGLDGGGVGSARRLADAHEAALDGRSFRLRIILREYDDGGIRGVVHERAVVAASGRYRSEVRRIGTVDHGSVMIGAAGAYSDGERRYVRSVGGDGDAAGESPTLQIRSTMPTTEPNRLIDRTRRYVRWYLSVNESQHTGTVDRDGTTLYAIDLEGDPWPTATNVSGRALVSETGVVREIRRTYVPRSDRSVRVEMVVRVTPEPVEVTRPGWVLADEPRHGVEGSETAGGNDTDVEVPRPPRNASAANTSQPALRPIPAV